MSPFSPVGLSSHAAQTFEHITGLNHRTESLNEAIAFNAEQAKILERIDAAEAAARIERRITDQSRQFSVWVGVEA